MKWGRKKSQKPFQLLKYFAFDFQLSSQNDYQKDCHLALGDHRPHTIQHRMQKARTISEPTSHDVELMCCHFASPIATTCCRSMSDVAAMGGISETIGVPVPPIKLTRTPPTEISVCEDKNPNEKTNFEGISSVRSRFKNSGNFSSREDSWRDQNFFADNSCNNTVIHLRLGF